MCPALPLWDIGTTWRIRLNLPFLILWPTRVHNPNGTSIGSAIFAQLMVKSPYILQSAPLSPKLAPSRGGPGPPSNLWLLGPIRTHNPNGISISSAVIAHDRRVSLYFTMGHRFSQKIDLPTHYTYFLLSYSFRIISFAVLTFCQSFKKLSSHNWQNAQHYYLTCSFNSVMTHQFITLFQFVPGHQKTPGDPEAGLIPAVT